MTSNSECTVTIFVVGVAVGVGIIMVGGVVGTDEMRWQLTSPLVARIKQITMMFRLRKLVMTHLSVAER